MAEGGATALGMDSGKMLLVDREDVIRIADEAGIAVVSVEDTASNSDASA
jgi:DUF1009 family protein